VDENWVLDKQLFGSLVINLPRKFLKKLRWRENQLLSLELDEKNKRIIIKDAKNKK